jgi:hypothetical protein
MSGLKTRIGLLPKIEAKLYGRLAVSPLCNIQHNADFELSTLDRILLLGMSIGSRGKQN